MALTQLQLACRETVDESTLENYEKVKQEYDRGAQEVLKARSLLQQLAESQEDLEEKLIYTIHYEVSWDIQEQKRGNVNYFLYIKARKQEYMGILRKFSIKGRSRKVGKGVSGSGNC